VSALSARLDKWLALIAEPLAAMAVVAEVVILLTGVIARFGFNHPLTWSDELATITFLWLAMLGAVIALRRSQHMRMTAVLDRFAGATRGVLEAIGSVAPVLFLAIVLSPARAGPIVRAHAGAWTQRRCSCVGSPGGHSADACG
jgi:TRAP-type C4-dicarboxylate transport system permease small subunit